MSSRILSSSSSLYSAADDGDAVSIDMSIRSLSDVPEEGRFTPTSPIPNSPYTNPGNPATSSTSTFNGPAQPTSGSTSASGIRTPSGSRKPSSVRTLGRSSNETLSVPGSSKRSTTGVSSPSVAAATAGAAAAKDGKTSKVTGTLQKIRSTPRLPHDKDVEPAPSTIMYWSRAPIYGTIPMRTMRAHSVTLVDTTAWLFGGCDDKDCSKDIYCFDTETMQWSHPDTLGEIPPPCRAHTSTLVDRKLVIFGGGQGPTYYDSVYVLDTTTRRWTRPSIPRPSPAPRRAHTAVLYRSKIWVFGGGNGMTALNDVWTLDVNNSSKMKWQEIETTGRKPGPRGYHTANLIGNVMIVVGGSDGKECFTDIWCLNLETLVWSQVKLQPSYRRLSHSATQVGSYLFIMGGHNGNEYSSELLLFNLVSLQYENRPVLGKPPSARGYHATLLADSRLFLFGGYNGSSAYDDVHILDLAAGAYLPQVTSFNIEA